MKLRTLLVGGITSLLLVGCHRPQVITDVQVVAKVNDRSLTRKEVLSILPKKVSSADSLLMCENYIKNWVKDALIYDLALRNLDDNEKAEIDKLVDDYRHSLVRYRYQERLIKERLSANLRESDKINFYEANLGKFKLESPLIQGLFLKIPLNAPGLADIKKVYRFTTDEALKQIEKYSVQNAVLYDSFYDQWVDFNELLTKIPLRVSDTDAFLRNNKYIDVSDSSYCYLVNIKEYLLSGKTAPYEYAEPHIVEMLTNQRKMDFLKNFENELYDDAVKNGTAVLAGETASPAQKQK